MISVPKRIFAIFKKSRHLIKNHLYVWWNTYMSPTLLHSKYFLVFIYYPVFAFYRLKNRALPQSWRTAARLTSVSDYDIPRCHIFQIFVFRLQSYPWYTDSGWLLKILWSCLLLPSRDHKRRCVIILCTRINGFLWPLSGCPLLLAKRFLNYSLNLLWGNGGMLRTLKSQMWNVIIGPWGPWMRQ